MAEVTQQQVVEYIKAISVLELSQLVKTLTIWTIGACSTNSSFA